MGSHMVCDLRRSVKAIVAERKARKKNSLKEEGRRQKQMVGAALLLCLVLLSCGSTSTFA
jgi:hypothetical protein